jgi:hypothetical protein
MKQVIYNRARGRCECSMKECAHHNAGVRCNGLLVSGQWWIYRKIASGPDTPANLIALCHKCYKNARAHGGE